MAQINSTHCKVDFVVDKILKEPSDCSVHHVAPDKFFGVDKHYVAVKFLCGRSTMLIINNLT